MASKKVTAKKQTSARASGRKAREFTLQTGFNLGYRNREDKTMLPPGYMVEGSKNVLTNVNNRLSSRKGYTIDGVASMDAFPIMGAFDWTKLLNNDTHVRSYNDRVEFRYVNPVTSAVEWTPIITGLASPNFNFTTLWDTDNLTTVMLGVNGTSNIYEWSGGVGTLSSVSGATGFITSIAGTAVAGGTGYTVGDVLTIVGGTATVRVDAAPAGMVTDVTLVVSGSGYTTGTKATTGGTGAGATIDVTALGNYSITITGTQTFIQHGFYPNNASVILIDNTGVSHSFQYTLGANTTTIVGLSANPTAFTFTPNETTVFQAMLVTPNASMTGIPADFPNALIGNLLNQIYIGGLNSNYLYISRLSDYTDYTQVDPAEPRAPGDGAIKTLGGYLTALVVQDQDMYIGAGRDLIYRTNYVQSTVSTTISTVDVAKVYEQINIDQVKTTSLQGMQSQYGTTKIKNNIAYLSFEPIINSLGQVVGINPTPQISDLSYSIVNDMNQYNFLNAACFYFRQYLYVAVPAEGLLLVYNMTDSSVNDNGTSRHYWEAPQSIPIGRFSVIDDQLYGHAYDSPNTYKLFDGYNDNGQPIQAVVKFSFINNGVRAATKSFNQFYVEGYISTNTTLTLGLQYDIDGCATTTSYPIIGTDRRAVCIISSGASLGKRSFGKNPLGSTAIDTSRNPKFRTIKTFPRTPYYEYQASFSSLGIDQQWEIVSYGGCTMITFEGNNSITQ